MTNLMDVVDIELLEQMMAEGYVKVQTHPEYGYRIYNYTDKAVFDRVWNEATLNCRGLITDTDGKIIARGMPKFFNYNQDGAPQFDLGDAVYVADKADGSLGILYRAFDQRSGAIATRGSFTSDQAIHATEIYDGSFDFSAPGNNTFLFEIVYPENRIVVDYGDRDALVYLGYVENDSGRFHPSTDSLVGLMTYAEALALPPRDNAEGLVLTRVSDGAMLKIKYDEYLRLHRIIFGLNARKLWQLIIDGEDVDEYIAALPDEFQPWAKDVVENLEKRVTLETGLFSWRYEQLVEDARIIYGEGCERADFAELVRNGVHENDRWAMFMLYDGRDIEPTVWKRMKPGPGITPVAPRTEEVA